MRGSAWNGFSAFSFNCPVLVVTVLRYPEGMVKTHCCDPIDSGQPQRNLPLDALSNVTRRECVRPLLVAAIAVGVGFLAQDARARVIKALKLPRDHRPDKGARAPEVDTFLARSALAITARELAAMPAAATAGETKPNAASGMITTL